MEPLIQIALSDKYLKTQNISKVIDVLRQYIMIEEHRKSICDSYKKIFETIAENMRQSYESLQKACAYLKDWILDIVIKCAGIEWLMVFNAFGCY